MSVYIIAEAGVNHNGKIELARKMVIEAKEAGADCIKFQTFVAANIVSKHALKADYQKQQTDSSESQLSMLQKLELSFSEFIELQKLCYEQGIHFLSTPFDTTSIDFLRSIDMDIWKIPSGEITNLPYLIKIAKFHKPVILSTGMCTLSEIDAAMKVLCDFGSGEITLLHCTTEYPVPFSEVNLRAMDTLRQKFHTSVGYSDHTRGIEVPIAAVAMGAEVIEKHFTLDRSMEGPDHSASLEPQELKAMVSAIRNIEQALGSGEKKPSDSEVKNMVIARKSIVASCYIVAGDYFTEENITAKRPGDGISPMRWFEVLGRKASRNYEEDEMIVL